MREAAVDPAERAYRVAIGPVTKHKIEAGDLDAWRDFNGSFSNRSLQQTAICSALYEGRPITTWHKDHWRHSRNYLLGQHIAMDFDTGDKRSAMTTLMRDPFILRWGSIVYTTPGHTPDAPRARVVFLLDEPIRQPQNYVLATAALLWLFGSADRQCKDPARFFYGGRPGACEMEWLAHELPLELVKDIIRRYQASGAQQHKRLSRRYEGQTPDEAKVLDALKHIDAWGIDYDQWLRVLMAIHSEFPGENGLAIADSWAQGRPQEVPQKWRGFDTAGNVQGRVGIGTLFSIAKDHGWQSTL